MPEKVFIYALCEPGTRTIRYIGQSKNPTRRFSSHRNTSSKERSRLGNWLKSLSRRREKPVLAILHEVSGNSWAEEEKRYISCARALGLDLVNATEGGEGSPNPSEEVREKIRMSKLGVKRSPEARAAMSAGRRGMKLSPEHRAKIGASLRGRPASAKQRAALIASNIARKGLPKKPFSKAHRAALSAAGKGRTISQRTRDAVRAANKLRRAE